MTPAASSPAVCHSLIEDTKEGNLAQTFPLMADRHPYRQVGLDLLLAFSLGIEFRLGKNIVKQTYIKGDKSALDQAIVTEIMTGLNTNDNNT